MLILTFELLLSFMNDQLYCLYFELMQDYIDHYVVIIKLFFLKKNSNFIALFNYTNFETQSSIIISIILLREYNPNLSNFNNLMN